MSRSALPAASACSFARIWTHELVGRRLFFDLKCTGEAIYRCEEDLSVHVVGRDGSMGDWRCTLDGRATRIVFDVVSVEHGGHHGHTGTSVSGAERRGRLWDRGAWAKLSLERATSTTVNFKHADGNNWFLRRVSTTQARGNSTWKGRAYPLSCTKGR
jgi:hypothetical protein